MSEEWRPVEGWPYEVSDVGRVRRAPGKSHNSSREGKALRPHIRNGYPSVTLCMNGVTKKCYVHHLVALAFVGPAPGPIGRGSWQINHIDGDKQNPRPENLEWVTHSGNEKHAAENGLKALGSRNASAVLGADEVREIKRRLSDGDETQKEIAEDFGVAPTTISAIHRGVNWGHVKIETAQLGGDPN